MPSAPEQISDESTTSNRGRWLFAVVVFMIGIVPIAAIANAVGPPPPACPGATYPVVSGDSWYRIAARSNVTMTALMNANGATTTTVIHPGQTLCLPGTVAATPTTAAPAATTAATTPAATGALAIDVFPAQGPCSFGDTYGAPRSGGRSHEGVDIIDKAGQWVYAVKDGTLSKRYIDAPGSLSGNGWRLTTSNGTYFFYAHLSAFAPGLAVGSPVKAGQIIGQVGMTGDAPIPHLHFEVHPFGGASVNPTPVVKAVDGCKTSVVPPQPGDVIPATTVPATTVPATTVPATTAPTTPTTVPTVVTTIPAPTPTSPPDQHRRNPVVVERPRRVAPTA
ncbi:MAG: LysM peptidoglycan-binding domain-containing M23 family metallopeptidase [Ilumatobacteraceae bacterium]